MTKTYFVQKTFRNDHMSMWVLCENKYCVYILLYPGMNQRSIGGKAGDVTKKIDKGEFKDNADLYQWIMRHTRSTIMSELDVIKSVIANRLTAELHSVMELIDDD